jgi:predicted nuclease with TOPRIM domain
MQQQHKTRLQSLKAEYEAGQQVLANLEAKKAGLRETLIRIGGAIQVLEEELAINQSGNAQPIEVLAKEDN